MAVLDLFQVTRTLQRLLDLGVGSLLTRALLPRALAVTTVPPERLPTAANTLNLHLYHAMESAHFRNDPAPGGGHPPVAREPLALSLFYILTAHHTAADDQFDAETLQRIFGLGLKTLHDHPVIDDDLQLPGPDGVLQPVLAAPLRDRGNHLEVVLRPITPEESLGFWSAEQSATTRLSAYYEVRTVLLEPEEPTRLPGTVIDVGLDVSTGRGPVLERASAHTRFSPPTATALGERVVETAPARAVLVPALDPPDSRVRLHGSGLAGDGRPGSSTVLVQTAAWARLDPPLRSAAVDPGLNPGWDVSVTDTAVTLSLRGDLDVDDGAGGIRTVRVGPGVYGVTVRTSRPRSRGAGRVDVESNQLAFSLGARIIGAAREASGRMRIRVAEPVDLDADEQSVQLAIDGEVYEEAEAFSGSPPADRGLFVRAARHLDVQPLFDAGLPGTHPVRLLVNGAESQPFWAELP